MPNGSRPSRRRQASDRTGGDSEGDPHHLPLGAVRKLRGIATGARALARTNERTGELIASVLASLQQVFEAHQIVRPNPSKGSGRGLRRVAGSAHAYEADSFSIAPARRGRFEAEIGGNVFILPPGPGLLMSILTEGDRQGREYSWVSFKEIRRRFSRCSGKPLGVANLIYRLRLALGSAFPKEGWNLIERHRNLGLRFALRLPEMATPRKTSDPLTEIREEPSWPNPE